MPKISNWTKMDSYGGVAGWKHDDRRVTVVVEGPRMNRDGYRVVRRANGGAGNIATDIKRQQDAIDRARDYMKANPEGGP